MTPEEKKEYDRKYYLAHKEKIKNRSRKYYADNKEYVQKRVKEYSEKNKEKISEYMSEYAKKNKERRRAYLEEYNEKNKDVLRKKKHEYAMSHKNEKAAYDKEYRKIRPHNNPMFERANKLYHNYKRNDTQYNREGFSLRAQFILEHIFNSSCIYCGDSNWKHLGCDRIDNTKPHTEDNIVCSCGICNIERANKLMSVEEFIEYRKTHPRELNERKLESIVEVNGKKVLRKNMSA